MSYPSLKCLLPLNLCMRGFRPGHFEHFCLAAVSTGKWDIKLSRVAPSMQHQRPFSSARSAASSAAAAPAHLQIALHFLYASSFSLYNCCATTAITTLTYKVNLATIIITNVLYIYITSCFVIACDLLIVLLCNCV